MSLTDTKVPTFTDNGREAHTGAGGRSLAVVDGREQRVRGCPRPFGRNYG